MRRPVVVDLPGERERIRSCKSAAWRAIKLTRVDVTANNDRKMLLSLREESEARIRGETRKRSRGDE